MKALVNIVMLLFVVFLSTPTIVTLIEQDSDTSYFFSLTEEEQHAMKEIKEVKADFKLPVFHFEFAEVEVKKPIDSELRIRHDNVTPTIFSPPPNV